MRALHHEVLDGIGSHISSGCIRHFYLFTGGEGAGKRTLAKLAAKMILCRDASPGAPCGKCLSCRTFDAGTNLDFIYTEPCGANPDTGEDDEDVRTAVKKTGNILIEESRQIIDRLITKPAISRRKAVIIAEAHKMTENAKACLLKTLEEPPSYASVILTCPDKDLLTDTIVSRTFHFMLRPREKEEIKAALPEATPFALEYGNGNIGRTLYSMRKEFRDQRKAALMLLNRVISGNTDGMAETEYVREAGQIFGLLLEAARDMLVIRAGSRRLINSDLEETLVKMSAGTDYRHIRGIIQRALKAEELLQINTNKRIVFYNFLYGN